MLRSQRQLFSRVGALALVLALGMLCMPTGAFAQDTGTVTGTIIDENQKPLPGAQVVVVGTQ